MPGEFDFIDWIRTQARSSPLVHTGIGDDLAVLKWHAGDLLLVGVDQVLDGVHFDSARHSPELIGRKVMNRNLSDCAAMACLPAAAVATVALPRQSVVTPFLDKDKKGSPHIVTEDKKGSLLILAQQLFLGMQQAASVFDCPIVGGDTASWDAPLAMTVTLLGRSAGITPITRSGARVGDSIYVTGPLGGSILGRHLTFTPCIALARELAATGNITAMIDLSDGLSRDLGHICRASRVGALLDADRIPIHDDALALSRQDHLPPIDHALHDGEDHELLLTGQFDPHPHLTRIGTVVEGDQIALARAGIIAPLPANGWEHRL